MENKLTLFGRVVIVHTDTVVLLMSVIASVFVVESDCESYVKKK